MSLTQLTTLPKNCVNALEKCFVYKDTTKGNQFTDSNTVTENKIYDTYVKYEKPYDIGNQYGT